MNLIFTAATTRYTLFVLTWIIGATGARADDAQPTRLSPVTCSAYFVRRVPAEAALGTALDSAVALITRSSDSWIPRDLPRSQAQSLRARIDAMATLIQDGRTRFLRSDGYRVFLSQWSGGLTKLESMRRFVESLPDGTEKTYFQRVLNASVSALFRHSHVALSATRPQEIDVARIKRIIDQIAAFEPARARFSLYRIKREIERGYSLREFTLCL